MCFSDGDWFRRIKLRFSQRDWYRKATREACSKAALRSERSQTRWIFHCIPATLCGFIVLYIITFPAEESHKVLFESHIYFSLPVTDSSFHRFDLIILGCCRVVPINLFDIVLSPEIKSTRIQQTSVIIGRLTGRVFLLLNYVKLTLPRATGNPWVNPWDTVRKICETKKQCGLSYQIVLTIWCP